MNIQLLLYQRDACALGIERNLSLAFCDTQIVGHLSRELMQANDIRYCMITGATGQETDSERYVLCKCLNQQHTTAHLWNTYKGLCAFHL